MKFQQLVSIKPWSLKFWLVSVIAVTILSCSATLFIVIYGLISESLKPCGLLDSYFNRSNCLKILQFSYHESHILDISYSPDGQLIAAGGIAGIPKIWNVNTGELLYELNPQAGGAIDTILFSPDGQTIAFAQNYTSNTLTLVDSKNGSILVQLRDYLPISDITYSPDGTILAVASTVDDTNTIELRRVSDGQLLSSFGIGHGMIIEKIVFSQDGQELLVAVINGVDKEISTWQVSDGVQIDEITLAVRENLGIAFSPTRELVALGNCVELEEINCAKAEITLWQVSDGQLLHRLDVPGSYVNNLTFSADGTILASSSEGDAQGYIQLWHVHDGTLLDTLEEHTGLFNKLEFSPDGTILAIGLSDITLWKIE